MIHFFHMSGTFLDILDVRLQGVFPTVDVTCQPEMDHAGCRRRPMTGNFGHFKVYAPSHEVP